MTGMPYNFETGPTFEVFEDVMNGDTARLVKVCNDLCDPTVRLTDVLGLDSTTLDAPQHPTVDDRVKQVNEQWFGMHEQAGRWVAQGPFNPAAPKNTGSWTSWHGDATAIVRTTLLRAAEVALGLPPRRFGDPPVTLAATTRHWPVMMIWKCGQNWFEGWVSWREAANAGLVVAIFATPGNGAAISRSPLAPPNRPLPEYAEFPPRPGQTALTSVARARGHWVVGHVNNRPHPYVGGTVAPTPAGAITLPTLLTMWVGEGDIVTVAPSEPDGGVLANGRPYTAPTNGGQ